MLPVLLAPILTKLAENGLTILSDAITSKGKEFVEDKIGIKIPEKEDQLTPEIIATLKQAEMQHEKELIELSIKKQQADLEEEKIYLQDVQNARNMQVAALQQQDVFSKRFIYYFASVAMAVTTIYIFWITFGDIPEKNIRFADTILGFLLGTLVSTIINFFFGTSKGSKDKDDTLAILLKRDKNE